MRKVYWSCLLYFLVCTGFALPLPVASAAELSATASQSKKIASSFPGWKAVDLGYGITLSIPDDWEENSTPRAMEGHSIEEMLKLGAFVSADKMQFINVGLLPLPGMSSAFEGLIFELVAKSLEEHSYEPFYGLRVGGLKTIALASGLRQKKYSTGEVVPALEIVQVAIPVLNPHGSNLIYITSIRINDIYTKAEWHKRFPRSTPPPGLAERATNPDEQLELEDLIFERFRFDLSALPTRVDMEKLENPELKFKRVSPGYGISFEVPEDWERVIYDGEDEQDGPKKLVAYYKSTLGYGNIIVSIKQDASAAFQAINAISPEEFLNNIEPGLRKTWEKSITDFVNSVPDSPPWHKTMYPLELKEVAGHKAISGLYGRMPSIQDLPVFSDSITFIYLENFTYDIWISAPKAGRGEAEKEALSPAANLLDEMFFFEHILESVHIDETDF